MFAGTFTALVTPFRNDQLDEPAFASLVEAQVAGGVTGIVPVGTTGESPTLDHDEHLRVIELAVQTANGRVKVMAGTGSNCTKEALEYTIEIAVETVARLAADCPNIIAIKEAGGKVERVIALKKAVPAAFEILSGDDGLTVSFIKEGAVGVVSVASNIVPREVSDLVGTALAGRWDEAQVQHDRMSALFTNLFIESNPTPTKQALAWQGRMSPEVRLPLCELTTKSQETLRTTLRDLKLVS